MTWQTCKPGSFVSVSEYGRSSCRTGQRDWLTPYAVALAENPDQAALSDELEDQVGEYVTRADVAHRRALGGMSGYHLRI
jgi:hypothetical protein